MWCGRSRVRFALTPTGLTDPLSWKESLSATHLNFTRPKPQPQWIGGWRGWVGCGMGWESESGSCRVWWLKLNCWNGWREDTWDSFSKPFLLMSQWCSQWKNLDYKRDWTSLNGKWKIKDIWWILSTKSYYLHWFLAKFNTMCVYTT